MIKASTLLFIFSFLEIMLFTLIIVISIYVFAKKKYSIAFLTIHLVIMMIAILGLFVILNNGKIIGYNGGYSISNIRSVDKYGDGYKVTLETGKAYYIDYAVYGEKTRIIEDTTLIKDTVLKVKVLEKNNLLIIKDKNVDFSKMPKSEISNYVTEMELD